MITFVSLFLGLVVGVHTVEVLPSAEVARVTLVLDGRSLAVLSEEPWSTKLDFGVDLLPHRLEAIAFDQSGVEIDRAIQWINLHHSSAEASLNLELDPKGLATKAKVSWEAIQGSVPRTSRVELDGVALVVEDVASFMIPPYDPNGLHFLRVELDFAEEVVATVEATFGGFYADTVNTELTSVVIELEKDRKVGLSDLSGRFVVAGERLDPVAVEKGDAEIIVVRDATAQNDLRALYAMLGPEQVRRAPKHLFLKYYWTRPIPSKVGDQLYLLHPYSSARSMAGRDLVSALLVQSLQPKDSKQVQLIAGASAVAGLAAAAPNNRRVVLVILGEPGADRSYLSPAVVRGFLGTVDVPMEVWTTAPRKWRQQDAQGWGAIVGISAGWRLRRAIDGVVRRLKRQRIVWFSGRYLPQEIVLDSQAPFRRVGARMALNDSQGKGEGEGVGGKGGKRTRGVSRSAGR